MYIGKLGDGSQADDGIYVLLKEVIDNSIDEFMMGNGRKNRSARVRRKSLHSRLWPWHSPGQTGRCGSKMNTGAKYDSKAFKKSVGLNGVGVLKPSMHFRQISW
jgi:topoisomerase IV subunit B